MMSYDEEHLLALSGIQHFVFCRRQWGLIHVDRSWQDNALTVLGEQMHRRAHDSDVRERRGDLLVLRGVSVVSWELGLTGQCDVVECRRGDVGCNLTGEKGLWTLRPIEYKRGAPKEADADRLQLCAQAMCLEEMLACDIPSGELYYGKTRAREHVAFSSELRDEVVSLSDEMHRYFQRGRVPNARARSVCKSCSLKDYCMPKRLKSVGDYLEIALGSG